MFCTERNYQVLEIITPSVREFGNYVVRGGTLGAHFFAVGAQWMKRELWVPSCWLMKIQLVMQFYLLSNFDMVTINVGCNYSEVT